MKFFDQMYVGFKRDRYVTAEEPRLLGFAVPYDTTKSSQNRVETVNRWKDKELDGRILDNSPTRGFKLVEVVSRYSTSNKLFRVVDPRGFELEITADNLLDLALQGTISRGEIVGECVWAQHNKIYLVPTDHELYKLHTSQKTKGKTVMEKGNYYVSGGNAVSVFRFEGIFHHTYLETSHFATKARVEQKSPINYNYRTTIREILVDEYETRAKIQLNSGKKPSYLYTEFRLDSDGNISSYIVHARKSHFKDLVSYDDNTDQFESEYNFDPLAWIDNSDGYQKKDSETPSIYLNGSGSYHGFFETKEAAKNFDYNPIIHTIKPTDRWRDRLDVSLFESRNDYWDYWSYNTRNDVHFAGATQKFVVDDQR